MRKIALLDELIGWYGAIAIITGYGLVSFGVIGAETLLYQVVNLTGALGIAYISYKKQVFQSVILNSIWGIIAVIAIARVLIG